MGEGPGVDRQPGFLVLAGPKSPEPQAIQRLRAGSGSAGLGQRPLHLPQLAHLLVAELGGHRDRGREVAVRPDPRSGRSGDPLQLGEQRPAMAAADDAPGRTTSSASRSRPRVRVAARPGPAACGLTRSGPPPRCRCRWACSDSGPTWSAASARPARASTCSMSSAGRRSCVSIGICAAVTAAVSRTRRISSARSGGPGSRRAAPYSGPAGVQSRPSRLSVPQPKIAASSMKAMKTARPIRCVHGRCPFSSLLGRSPVRIVGVHHPGRPGRTATSGRND